MLSLDRKRIGNDKKAAPRSRSRFIPPVLESIPRSIPRSTPVEQLPFPMVNGNVLRPCLKSQRSEQFSVLSSSSSVPARTTVSNPDSGMYTQESLHPPAERRVIVGGAVCVLCVFVLLSTCLTVLPSGDSGPLPTFNPLNPLGSLHPILGKVSVSRSSLAMINSLSATATAVSQDGYDPGNLHFASLPAPSLKSHISVAENSKLEHFLYGQCTYWANMRYHQLTGHWISWSGSAYQWAYEAPAYGWTISDTPNPHGASIMVFSPYAEGSGPYGHVAVVERVNSDGSVYTSNWNWNGTWATQSYMTFYPTNGVSFIWFPG